MIKKAKKSKPVIIESEEDDKSFNWADVQNPRISKTEDELLEEELERLSNK